VSVSPGLLLLAFALGCKSDLRTGWNAESDAGGAKVSVTAAVSGDSGSMKAQRDAGAADAGTVDGSTGSPSAPCGGSGWAQAELVRDGGRERSNSPDLDRHEREWDCFLSLACRVVGPVQSPMTFCFPIHLWIE
jgi:hypothetical protein